MRMALFLVSMLAGISRSFPRRPVTSRRAVRSGLRSPRQVGIPIPRCIALTSLTRTRRKKPSRSWRTRSVRRSFPGETFEISSGAGRKTYKIACRRSQGPKITVERESWKRTIKDLAVVLSNTGVVIDERGPPALTGTRCRTRSAARRVRDPYLSSRRSRRSRSPHSTAKVESNTAKFKVVLR